MADKATDKLFSSVNLCTGQTPITKEEINEVINPAIVVRDSVGSLLEHTGSVLRSLTTAGGGEGVPGLSAGGAGGSDKATIHSTPPRRERNLSVGSGSPASGVAEVVASISMVIRYSDQLRNALGYMLVQSEHDDEKKRQ